MKIQIKSRAEIEELILPENVAVISITDFGDVPVEFKNSPSHILRLAFDDVDGDIFIDESHKSREEIICEYHMLSDIQAQEIAEFINAVWDKVDTIICQCEHGQSRSAAIAAAIIEHRNRNGIAIFADDRYYPNKLIYRQVYKALTK